MPRTSARNVVLALTLVSCCRDRTRGVLATAAPQTSPRDIVRIYSDPLRGTDFGGTERRNDGHERFAFYAVLQGDRRDDLGLLPDARPFNCRFRSAAHYRPDRW